MIKVKHARTADCVVAGFRWHKSGKDAVGSLLLGLYDDAGVLHHVGVTSSFTMARRKELAKELEPLRKDALDAIPGGTGPRRTRTRRAGMPGAQSRWSAGKDLSWEPLRIERVCEVKYDHLQGDRFRHAATFLRWRPDKPPEDCRYDQLEVTAPYELRGSSRPDSARLLEPASIPLRGPSRAARGSASARPASCTAGARAHRPWPSRSRCSSPITRPAAAPASRRDASIPACGSPAAAKRSGMRHQGEFARVEIAPARPSRTARRPARRESAARSTRPRRCDPSRSGCNPRTRRDAPPSTICWWRARARAARPRAPAPAPRAAPRRSPTAARSAPSTCSPREPDVLGQPVRPNSPSVASHHARHLAGPAPIRRRGPDRDRPATRRDGRDPPPAPDAGAARGTRDSPSRRARPRGAARPPSRCVPRGTGSSTTSTHDGRLAGARFWKKNSPPMPLG